MDHPKRVPFDPELRAALAAFKAEVELEPLTPDTIEAYRVRMARTDVPLEQIIANRPVKHEDISVPGPPGSPDITLAVLRPTQPPVTPAPAVYAIHGGGMILGTRLSDAQRLVEIVVEFGVVVVSVEYRLAPEHPHPAPVEDCYAGLSWTYDHAEDLGIDKQRLVIRGGSSGGGLAAGAALLARDRDGPRLAGQMLICPMIDDGNDSLSCRQYEDIGPWDRSFNETGWNALLGSTRGSAHVSPYAAPTRASDVTALPPTFIEVGAAEIFRDEAVDYASRLWAAGNDAELHVWAGGFHGFVGVYPQAPVSRAALAARLSWLSRRLCG